MNITCSSPETFKCIRIIEEKPYNNANGQYIKQKNVVEKVASINEHGFITITTNGSIVNNNDCEINKCNNYAWSEKKYYTPDGVMRDREYKHFKKSELTVNFNNATIDSILYIPRQAFDASSFWHDKYESRTLLLRDKLDTARVVMEDRNKGIKYSAITPLKQEHGLRDMVLPNSYESYPQNIVIPPLSKEEIETMIQRENNPKVREGLRKYAVDRTTYSYNSNEDKYFISEGITQSKNISR